jgi:hypothetical protein
VFRGYVDRGWEEGALACDGGDVWYAAWFLAGQEVRDCYLGYADGVRDVDVDEGVAGFRGVVFGGRASWRVPEVGPWLWRGRR